METKTVYVTKDGAEFDSKIEAQHWGCKQELDHDFIKRDGQATNGAIISPPSREDKDGD